MVFAYCRKDDNHSAQRIKDWADNNTIIIDEFVWEDETKQKDTFDKRELGMYLFPKVKEGDLLIVSEVSCIGRSAIELQRIIESVFVIKRIRIVCLSMNFDIDFAKITALDSNLLEMFFFAAKLQKTIIHEMTKAALAAKKNKGVKLGAANDKYKNNLMSKSQKEIDYIHLKHGLTKNKRYIDNPETKAFIKILIKVFNLDEDFCKWDWEIVTTKGHYKNLIYKMMHSLQKSEGFFIKWDFNNSNENALQRKLATYIHTMERSLTSYCSNKKYENITLEDYSKFLPSKESKVSPESLPKLYKRKKEQTLSNQHIDIILDTSQLSRIEQDTMESQNILSDIFADTDLNDDYKIEESSPILDILKVLFTKEVWSIEDVERICNNHKLMIGSVLEQINDYALEKVDDIIIEDDGDNIYVMTDYKDKLI